MGSGPAIRDGMGGKKRKRGGETRVVWMLFRFRVDIRKLSFFFSSLSGLDVES